MDPIIVPVLTALIGVAMRAIAVAELLARLRPRGRRARAGQVGFDGRRIGAPQPDRQEPQLTAHLIQLRAQVGALEVVGEVFPQVPAAGCFRQPPPLPSRRPARCAATLRRPHRARPEAGLR